MKIALKIVGWVVLADLSYLRNCFLNRIRNSTCKIPRPRPSAPAEERRITYDPNIPNPRPGPNLRVCPRSLRLRQRYLPLPTAVPLFQLHLLIGYQRRVTMEAGRRGREQRRPA
jgi:hypothetical protein